jgi:hypothetical protein
MNTTLIASLVLGVGSLSTAFYAVITQVRDRARSVRKQESGIAIDEQTFERIKAEAAQVGSDQRIATERWWKEQFDAVKAELVTEQEWRREMSKRLRRHQPWDDHMYREAAMAGWNIEPPPKLDPEDDDSA